jgi:hypothetical protein
MSAIQLRRDGYTWDQIAEAVGFPTGRAALVATETALEAELATSESHEFMRKLAGDRLDRMLRSVWKKATDPTHPEHLAALDRARILVAQHADLFGYVAPKRQVNINPSAAQLEKWVAGMLAVEAPEVEEADIFEAELVDDDAAQAG